MRAPLGALAHLLPAGIADERVDLVAVVAAVRPVVLDLANDGPLVLFVDDLHLLDGTSAALVAQLVDADLVFLVATVRTPEPACRRGSSRCGTERGFAASTCSTSTGRRSTRSSTSCSADRSRRPRRETSGQQARATSCSSASSCSARSSAGACSTSAACGA